MEVVSDRNRLVAALREREVDYLAPSDAIGDPIADDMLIASLAAHPDSRLRQALIALFLLQPRCGRLVLPVRGQLASLAAQELTAFYTAAVYLQTMWRFRLKQYQEPVEKLADYFSAELGLPVPEDEYGKAGLYALAEWQASQSLYRFNHLSAYEGVADLVFQSLKLKRQSNELAPAS